MAGRSSASGGEGPIAGPRRPIPDGASGRSSRDSASRQTADEDLRIGPYDVFKRLVDAPGASMVEARDRSGQQWLLQLAHCRPARSSGEEPDWRDYERMISVATQHLSTDPDVKVYAHGAVERPGGAHILYWALDWNDDARHLGRGASQIRSVHQLIISAMSLLKRLDQRHERGRLEPLVSEDLLIVKPSGETFVAGVPIHLPLEWLAEDMLPARLAPEERQAREPGRAGDLWRLGMALKELAKGLSDAPEELGTIFDGLGDPDPKTRLATGDALIELQLLDTTLEQEHGDSGPDHTFSGPLDSGGEAHGLEQKTELLPIASMTPASRRMLMLRKLAAAPTLANVNLRVKDGAPGGVPPPSKSSGDMLAFGEAVTAQHVMPAERGSGDRDSRRAQAVLPETAAGESGNVTWLDIPMEAPRDYGDPVSAIIDAVTPVYTNPSRRNAWDEANRRTQPPAPDPKAKGTLVGLRTMGPKGTVVGVRPLGARFRIVSIRALGAAEPRPEPPDGEPSPNQPAPELEEARSFEGRPSPEGRTNLRDRTEQDEERPDAPRPIERDAPGEPDLPEDQPPPPRPRRRRFAVDAVAVLLLSVLFGLAFQRLVPFASSKYEQGTRPISPTTEVRLDVSPSEALVVAEDDGTVLGKTPLTFLLPSEPPTAVLIAAKGFEPQRIVLPERGRISSALLPLDKPAPCSIDLRVPDNVRLEGVGGEFEAGGKVYKIPGAIVLRDMRKKGAWLVRCPSLGGTTVQTLATRPPIKRIELNITAPTDGTAYARDEKLGHTPIRLFIEGGFAPVKIELDRGGSAERWVPLFTDTSLEMPQPSPPGEK